VIERKYRERIRQEAEVLYESLDNNEKTGVQFGMLPYAKATAAEAKLLAEFQEKEGRSATPREKGDFGRLLSVAVMDVANRGPKKMIC
jgi:hypothetical protein